MFVCFSGSFFAQQRMSMRRCCVCRGQVITPRRWTSCDVVYPPSKRRDLVCIWRNDICVGAMFYFLRDSKISSPMRLLNPSGTQCWFLFRWIGIIFSHFQVKIMPIHKKKISTAFQKGEARVFFWGGGCTFVWMFLLRVVSLARKDDPLERRIKAYARVFLCVQRSRILATTPLFIRSEWF